MNLSLVIDQEGLVYQIVVTENVDRLRDVLSRKPDMVSLLQ